MRATWNDFEPDYAALAEARAEATAVSEEANQDHYDDWVGGAA